MKLNSNIPSFKALVKKGYFTKKQTDEKEYYNVYVFGIQSCSGKILTFHVMTDTGMLRSRVPLSEIYFKENGEDIPDNFKQLWDCFSENVSVIEYDFLSYHKAQIVLRDGTKVWGMTIHTAMKLVITSAGIYLELMMATYYANLTTGYSGEIAIGLQKKCQKI
jgi:hypothetical protein